MGRSTLLGAAALVALLTGVAAVFTCGGGADARGGRTLPSVFQGREGLAPGVAEGYVVPPRFARPTPEPPPSLGDPALDALVARIVRGADELLALTVVEPPVCRPMANPPQHCSWMWISPTDLEQRVAMFDGHPTHLSWPETHRRLWGLAGEDGFTVAGAWRLPVGTAPSTDVVVLRGTPMVADFYNTFDGVLAFVDPTADRPVRAIAFIGLRRGLEEWRALLDPLEEIKPLDPAPQSLP